MDGRFFGACFSVFSYKNEAVAPVDYPSTFATAPFIAFFFNCLGHYNVCSLAAVFVYFLSVVDGFTKNRLSNNAMT